MRFFIFMWKDVESTYSVISNSQANSAKELVESSIAYKIKRQVTYTHNNRRKWLVLYREKGGKRDKWSNLPFPSDDCLPLFFLHVLFK